jgi:hypothetical protein
LPPIGDPHGRLAGLTGTSRRGFPSQRKNTPWLHWWDSQGADRPRRREIGCRRAVARVRSRGFAPVSLGDDIHDRLRDLHKHATAKRSHYYTGRCISDAINEITRLRKLLALS